MKRGVLYLTVEEGADDVLRGRFRVMGADADFVHVYKTSAQHFQLRGRAGELRDLIRELALGLIILDPWDSIVGAANDTDKGRVVRDLLDPAIAIAHEEKCLLGIIIHLKKARDAATALQLMSGSTGIGAAARGALFVGFEDPDVAEEEQDQRNLVRVVAPAKASNSYLRGGVSFKILPSPDDPKIPVIEWLGPTKVTAAAATRKPNQQRHGPPAAKREGAAAWLRERLASGEEVPARLVFEEGGANGYSEQTLRRAAASLGVQHRSLGADDKGRLRGAVWQLAQAVEEAV
jgi:hypothetical protein